MIDVTSLGPFPPAPVPPPPPQTLDEALDRLAYGDRGVIDAAAHVAFIRKQIAAAVAAEHAACFDVVRRWKDAPSGAAIAFAELHGGPLTAQKGGPR